MNVHSRLMGHLHAVHILRWILALGPQTLHIVPVEALENGHWERVRADLARFLGLEEPMRQHEMPTGHSSGGWVCPQALCEKLTAFFKPDQDLIPEILEFYNVSHSIAPS